MPAKKKPAKKTTRSRSVSRTTLVNSEAMASETSTDTKTIVVVLLLLFMYPLGLVFMWLWMKTWPTWLKIIISIPFIAGILAIIFGFTMIGFLIKSGALHDRPMYQMQNRREWRNISNNQNQFYISPTPTSY